MGFVQWIKEKVLRLTNGVRETTTTREQMKNMYFVNGSFSTINRFALDEFNVWYNGDETKMLEFYTEAHVNTYPNEYIRTRNCRQMFWAQTVKVDKLKRTSGGLARTITTTLCNIISCPDIYSASDKYDKLVKNILDENDFIDKSYDRQMCKTLYEGWGAYRIDINTIRNEYPKIRYFPANDVYFATEDNDIVGVIFLSNYLRENRRYLILETRYVKTVNDIPYSCIDKEAYLVNEVSGSLTSVPLKDLDFLVDKESHIELENVPFILAEPCVFYELDGLENEGLYGRSIFYGKINALDDYDQAFSILQTNIRRSTSKVVYPVESLETTESGETKVPNDFDTEYMAVPNQTYGEGLDVKAAAPHVIQSDVDVTAYEKTLKCAQDIIAGGLISINDIGLTEQTFFRDSAEAIRERSRQTLYTVNYVRRKETKILKSLINKCVFLYEKEWENKNVSKENMKDYEVQIRYDKFLSPSAEQKIKSYLPMFQSGAISVEQFVRTIYEDQKSDEEMQEEIDRLNAMRNQTQNGAMGTNNGDGINFNKVPKFEKNSSPHQDEVANLSDNSGMNNHNRGIKNVKEI